MTSRVASKFWELYRKVNKSRLSVNDDDVVQMCYNGLMLDHKQPPNWVAKRADCRTDLIFKAVCEIVKCDVSEANKLPADLRHDRGFSTEETCKEGKQTLLVHRTCVDSPKPEVIASFQKWPHSILVKRMNEVPVHAVPEWNESALRCRVVVRDRMNDEKEHFELWQLSQRLLIGGFFEA